MEPQVKDRAGAEPWCGYSANISILFTELDFWDRPAAARQAGFDLVESWWPFSTPVAPPAGIDRYVQVLEDAGVRLTAVNFFAGDMAGGERGVACRPDRRHDLSANVDQVLELASRTGCRHFNLLYGQPDEDVDGDQRRCAMESYAWIGPRAAEIGGTVLIEPLARGLNGSYPLTTGADVVDLLKGPLEGVPGLALLFDVFHLGSNGVDLVRAASDLLPWVGHVQVADSPGRHEPGSGDLPIPATLATLRDRGYDGFVGCEYVPSGATAASLGWLSDAPAMRAPERRSA